MVQLHEGVEVEVIAEVMDLPDMPPGDELSSADAYDDLEDHPYECRDIAGGRHSLAGASGVSDLPSDISEREVSYLISKWLRNFNKFLQIYCSLKRR